MSLNFGKRVRFSRSMNLSKFRGKHWFRKWICWSRKGISYGDTCQKENFYEKKSLYNDWDFMLCRSNCFSGDIDSKVHLLDLWVPNIMGKAKFLFLTRCRKNPLFSLSYHIVPLTKNACTMEDAESRMKKAIVNVLQIILDPIVSSKHAQDSWESFYRMYFNSPCNKLWFRKNLNFQKMKPVILTEIAQ